ncbi:MAG: hypothetical protein R2867_33920 [Caldilineaceae bacterium]
MPGFILARTVYEMARTVDWQRLEGILLLNHGVFTFADDAKSSYERHIEIVSKAENYLATAATVVRPPATRNLEDLVTRPRCVAPFRMPVASPWWRSWMTVKLPLRFRIWRTSAKSPPGSADA